MNMLTNPKILLAAAAFGALGGCAVSQVHVGQDFGVALRQDVVAQIADPQAKYRGDPAPGSNGERVGLAQERYRTGTVIPPTATASSIGASEAPPAPGAGVGAGGGAPK
jgi:type IV pilus biogenesis protein CpaD/CtpE